MMDEMILEMLAEDDEDEEEEKKYCTDPEKVAESLRTLQKVKEELERKRWGEDDD
jgi:hypothetical protein